MVILDVVREVAANMTHAHMTGPAQPGTALSDIA